MAKKSEKPNKQGQGNTSENIPNLTDQDQVGSGGQTGSTTSAGQSESTTSAGQSGTTTSAGAGGATTSENIPDLSTGDKPQPGKKDKK